MIPKHWTRPRLVTFIVCGLLFLGFRYARFNSGVTNLIETPETISTRSALEVRALDGSWREGLSGWSFNRYFLSRMDACQSGDECLENNRKLVILGWDNFRSSLTGVSTPEALWCQSLMDTMHALGYSMLIALDNAHLYTLWREHHGQVRLIMWGFNKDQSVACLNNSKCVFADTSLANELPAPNKTHLNIPIWKIFHMHWWNGPTGPLGGPFTLSPENFRSWKGFHGGRDNYFLGYSLESLCSRTRYIPFHSRSPQVYILAEELKLLQENDYILNDGTGPTGSIPHSDFYARFGRQHNVTFMGQLNPQNVPSIIKRPVGITSVPLRLRKPELRELIAKTRVVLGVGHPRLTSSPYEGLCLGVPFINPVHNWNRDHPDDRAQWSSQHDALLGYGLDEPYVYHVKKGDQASLERAIMKALDTPIERFIVPHMKIGAMLERVQRLVETDWEPVGRACLVKSGYSPTE